MKTALNYFTLIAFLALAATSCKKKDLPESQVIGGPVFSFAGQVNGAQKNLSAGLNSYYMYSDYSQALNGLYSFTGTLKRTDCSTCESLKIIFDDDMLSAINGPSGADSSLKTGPRSFLGSSSGAVSITFTAQFNSSFNNAATSILWSFGDGGTSTSPNPVHTYTTASNYNVCLTMTDSSSCSSTVCNQLSIDTNSFRAVISTSFIAGNTVGFKSTVSGGTPASYVWNFGDGNFAYTANATHNYSLAGQYTVNLYVINTTNDTAYAAMNANTQGYPQCAANYTLYALNSSTTSSGPAPPNVTVEWTDATGQVFTSKSSPQPPTSYFNITSVSNYHTNEKGQKTKQVSASFRCTVYNGGSSVLIDNAGATIAVGYK